jgi:hypothetical protein
MTLHHSKHMGHDCALGKVDSGAECEASYTVSCVKCPLDRLSAVKVRCAIHNMK